MSSLRLALKMSMSDGQGGPPPPPTRFEDALSKPKKRKNSIDEPPVSSKNNAVEFATDGPKGAAAVTKKKNEALAEKEREQEKEKDTHNNKGKDKDKEKDKLKEQKKEDREHHREKERTKREQDKQHHEERDLKKEEKEHFKKKKSTANNKQDDRKPTGSRQQQSSPETTFETDDTLETVAVPHEKETAKKTKGGERGGSSDTATQSSSGHNKAAAGGDKQSVQNAHIGNKATKGNKNKTTASRAPSPETVSPVVPEEKKHQATGTAGRSRVASSLSESAPPTPAKDIASKNNARTTNNASSSGRLSSSRADTRDDTMEVDDDGGETTGETEFSTVDSISKEKERKKKSSAAAVTNEAKSNTDRDDHDGDKIIHGKDGEEDAHVGDHSSHMEADGQQQHAQGEESHDTANEQENGARKSSSKKRRRRSFDDAGAAAGDDGNDDHGGAGSDNEATEGTTRNHSSRAAALVAKTRMVKSRGGRGHNRENHGGDRDDDKEGEKEKDGGLEVSTTAGGRGGGGKRGRHSHTPATAAGTADAAVEWVCCDSCGKWRSLPNTVNMGALPEKWFCEMNEWDPLQNSCDAPEKNYNADQNSPVKPRVPSEADGSAAETIQGVDVSSRGPGRGKKLRASSSAGDLPAPLQPTTSLQEDRDGGGGSVDPEQTGAVPQSGRRRGGQRQVGRPLGSSSDAVEKVNWVQCNKCSKWRKVPASIRVEDLPDYWLCSLNTWAPAFSRCAAREETDTTGGGGGGGAGGGNGDNEREPLMPPAEREKPVGRSGKGGRGFGGGGGNTPTVEPPAAKKVTQWVQCERPSCKKWRKLPAHVDMAQLPEKWYCEMNRWDNERATCDGAEESDSSADGARRVRTQIVFNKGPSALSFRRIIFGTDGRIRPIYNEKNRNGYGVFSHCETHKQNVLGGGDHDEDYVEPLRKLSYWHSSAYFDANAVARKAEKEAAAVATAAADAVAAAASSVAAAAEAASASISATAVSEGTPENNNVGEVGASDADSIIPMATATSSSSAAASAAPFVASASATAASTTAAPPVSATDTTASPREPQQEPLAKKQQLPSKGLAERPEPPFLARIAACTVDPSHFQGNLFDLVFSGSSQQQQLQQPTHALLPPNKKMSKYPQILSSITAFRRESIECDIVKKSLLCKPHGVSVTFTELAKSLVSTRFTSPEVESVRIAMTLKVMKDAVRRLELIGEVIVCLNGVGEMCVRTLGILEPLKESRVADGLPLKMRKFFGRSPSQQLQQHHTFETA